MRGLENLIKQLAKLVNENELIVWSGRFLSVDFLLGIGNDFFHVLIDKGRVIEVVEGPVLMRPYKFSIRASSDAWTEFWKPFPKPGYHDLFAMVKDGNATIEGDLKLFLTHLRYIKEILALPRTEKSETSSEEDFVEYIEPVIGRYMNINVEGRSYRIYWEEAGEGIPLVCLHTAGADGQQFRHLMSDEALTNRFRVITFDMPWHGKSLPPKGFQLEEYRLTTKLYSETIRSVCRALNLNQPVIMGCSMGGRIVLHLARHWPEEFKAVIGLEGSDHQTPWYDRAWLHRPDIHGGETSAALVSGLIAPTSPSEARWETLWGYLASGPGIFKGDLNFYRVDSDYRDIVTEIDTKKCPVFLLTGEYDFSCSPDDTLRTSSKIKGSEVKIMENLGHFPMSENPMLFKDYLNPVLERIEQLDN